MREIAAYSSNGLEFGKPIQTITFAPEGPKTNDILL